MAGLVGAQFAGVVPRLALLRHGALYQRAGGEIGLRGRAETPAGEQRAGHLGQRAEHPTDGGRQFVGD